MSDSASPAVEFPAPKSEVVQRFPVCYLGCVPVAKPVGEWGTRGEGGSVSGVSSGPCGAAVGRGHPRIALTLSVSPRHGCDQRGAGGGARPWLGGAPCPHPRGGQRGPRHPDHCSPPGACPARSPLPWDPCPRPPSPCPRGDPLPLRADVLIPASTGDPLLFWGLRDPVTCQRACRDPSLSQGAAMAPSIVSPSQHIPLGLGGSPPTLGSCAGPSQPQGIPVTRPFLVGASVPPRVPC